MDRSINQKRNEQIVLDAFQVKVSEHHWKINKNSPRQCIAPPLICPRQWIAPATDLPPPLICPRQWTALASVLPPPVNFQLKNVKCLTEMPRRHHWADSTAPADVPAYAGQSQWSCVSPSGMAVSMHRILRRREENSVIYTALITNWWDRCLKPNYYRVRVELIKPPLRNTKRIHKWKMIRNTRLTFISSAQIKSDVAQAR